MKFLVIQYSINFFRKTKNFFISFVAEIFVFFKLNYINYFSSNKFKNIN